MSQQSKIQLRIERFQFAVRLASLHFPLSIDEITPIAEEAEYVVAEQLKRSLTGVPAGATLRVSGPIAEHPRSGNVLVLDAERGIIAITGREIQTVLDDFERFENITDNQLSLNIEEQARFYEYIFSADALLTGRNPMDEVSNLFHDSKLLERFGRVLGFEPISFGIRLVAKGDQPDMNSWSEIKIEPSLSRPTTTYSISTVHRSPTKQLVLEPARDLLKKIEDLLRLIHEVSAK